MVIKRGDTGAGVAEIRTRLAQLGLCNDIADGDPNEFDAELDRAVRAFQQERGITVDGVVGPQTFNFVEITASLIDAGAALRVDDEAELAATVIRLFADPALRKRLGTAGQAAFAREQGGVLRTLEIVERVLDGPSGRQPSA